VAHPGEEHEHVSETELARREVCIARHLQARKCASAISAFEAQRMMKRDTLMKRQTTTSSAAPPHYTSIQNSTCITAPEVTEGPYYIDNEYVRTDLSEPQGGVKLVLDVGVIDTTTCKPLPNVFVELWAANSTGVYGGYSGGGTTNIHKETFLRGGYYTNANGIVELTTSYPGYYQGRAAHIHTMLHKTWSQNANGTLVSHAGSLVRIGQFFFAETWNDKVFATAPYNTNKQDRTLNSQDSILTQADSGGNNAFINLQQLGNLPLPGPARLDHSRCRFQQGLHHTEQELSLALG
ncbi:Intradiol ring-cleavage dioxygenase, partial [Lyophyllum atratum]